MKDVKPNLLITPSKSKLQFNKRFTVVIVCFSISALFWFLIAMTHDYSSRISIPVTYENIPGKKVVINDLPKNISVIIKANGFKILSYSLKKNIEPITIDVASKMKSASISSGVLSIATKTFVADFNDQLGKEVSITGFEPDSIVFNFRDRETKLVPIIIDLKATFERQYDTTAAPVSQPSFVEVSGPPSLLKKLNSVKTELVEIGPLKNNYKSKVNLVTNHLLTYNINKVEIIVPVEKFTEGTVVITVNPINVTKGYSLKTFPEKVSIRYITSLSNYNKVSSAMFDAVVDAAGLEKVHPEKISVQLITSPDFVRSATLEPERVDYILRKQ